MTANPEVIPPVGRPPRHLAASSVNEPEERLRVLDAIDELVHAGMLDSCGGDFYALTEKGKGAVAQS